MNGTHTSNWMWFNGQSTWMGGLNKQAAFMSPPSASFCKALEWPLRPSAKTAKTAKTAMIANERLPRVWRPLEPQTNLRWRANTWAATGDSAIAGAQHSSKSEQTRARYNERVRPTWEPHTSGIRQSASTSSTCEQRASHENDCAMKSLCNEIEIEMNVSRGRVSSSQMRQVTLTVNVITI